MKWLIRVLRRFRRKIMWVKNCIIAPPFIDGWIKNTAWGTDIQ